MRPNDALKGVTHEYRARKRGCYMLEDKHGTYFIVAQKLATIVTFLNSMATDTASRVSLTALHEIVDSSPNNRVGGFSKHRWKLRFAPLERVAELFEGERANFQQSLILGPANCYTIESQSV